MKLNKPNSTKNKTSEFINPNNYNSFLFNSIPEEIRENDIKFNKTHSLEQNKNENEENFSHNRNSIHIEKNISNFFSKKNEDVFRDTTKSPLDDLPINSIGQIKNEE